ncbi:MAG: hypothetical protein JNJ58_12125 [Chitinophagaceae bacterium]|nr:hypothetical protein [Chitinophagaceae bacterium]
MKYAIAIDKTTGELKDATEVQNGLKCNCVCWNCSEDMVAINSPQNKKIKHFRHFVKSNCKSNYESYIHWLSKEVFKSINKLKLPPISFREILRLNDPFIAMVEAVLRNSGLRLDKLYYDYIIQPAQYLQFEKYSFESQISDIENTIRTDIVLIFQNNEELLIEPFYTNRIDGKKLSKLQTLDRSVISIDLIEFTNKNHFAFSFDKFKSFIVDDVISKNWVHIRSSKIEKLKIKYLNLLKKNIQEKEPLKYLIRKLNKENHDLHLTVSEENTLLHEILERIEQLKHEIKVNKDKIDDLENQFYLR